MSLSVASGPSVGVGEGRGGSTTRGNGVRDCDGVRRRMEDKGCKTVEGEALESKSSVATEGSRTHMNCLATSLRCE